MKLTALLGVGAMAFSAALLFLLSLIAQQRGDEHGREGARTSLQTRGSRDPWWPTSVMAR